MVCRDLYVRLEKMLDIGFIEGNIKSICKEYFIFKWLKLWIVENNWNM